MVKGPMSIRKNTHNRFRVRSLMLLALTSLLSFSSCEKLFFEDEPGTSNLEIFKQAWDFADREYSFFEYKNIRWDSVYSAFEPGINDNLSEEALFDILAEMFHVLRDGHVNLTTPFDRSRNWQWFLDYPENYDYSLLQRYYFKNQEQYAGPFILMDFEDLGYLHYRSFSNPVSEDNMDYVLEKFKDKKALIIDLRDNGGGSLSNVFRIANRFADKEVTVAMLRYKSGPGHEDFTPWRAVNLTPPDEGARWSKPVILLTNRLCYSATNFLVTLMKPLSNVTVIGDSTGGGGGIPAYTELSNGWVIRVSSTQLETLEGFNVENGLPPDIQVEQTQEDELQNRDSILEFAFEFINNL